MPHNVTDEISEWFFVIGRKMLTTDFGESVIYTMSETLH
jgi:hypothetical protein